MARQITIEKLVGSTRVQTLGASYNYPLANVFVENNLLTIEPINRLESRLPVLHLLFEEIVNNLGTTNILEYYEEITNLGYFSQVAGNGGSGGSGTTYDTPTLYDTPADLPITFAADTIHAISILCITGNLNVTINGEDTDFGPGEKLDLEADTLFDYAITLNSSTGTFKVVTMS